jgi:hypothetical protein
MVIYAATGSRLMPTEMTEPMGLAFVVLLIVIIFAAIQWA